MTLFPKKKKESANRRIIALEWHIQDLELRYGALENRFNDMLSAFFKKKEDDEPPLA